MITLKITETALLHFAQTALATLRSNAEWIRLFSQPHTLRCSPDATARCGEHLPPFIRGISARSETRRKNVWRGNLPPQRPEDWRQSMKYRIHIWGNMATTGLAFGIQCQAELGKRYKHCSATINGIHRALIYTTRSRAEQVITGLLAGSNPDLKPGLEPLKNP